MVLRHERTDRQTHRHADHNISILGIPPEGVEVIIITNRSSGTVYTSAKARLTSYAPPKFNHLFTGQLPTFPENFRWEVLHKVANRQTDRQTNKQRWLHILLGGVKRTYFVTLHRTQIKLQLNNEQQVLSLQHIRLISIGITSYALIGEVPFTAYCEQQP